MFTYTDEMRTRDKEDLDLCAENIRKLIKVHGKDVIWNMLMKDLDAHLDKYTREDGTVDIVAMMEDRA